MTQKADAHPGPRADVLYRLSAAYRRSLGLDATANATNTANTAQNPATPERRSKVAPSTGLYHQWVRENGHQSFADWTVNTTTCFRHSSHVKLSTKETLVFFSRQTGDAGSIVLTWVTFFSDNLEREIEMLGECVWSTLFQDGFQSEWLKWSMLWPETLQISEKGAEPVDVQ